uniref:Uncharacterized protein n=1 Tax=Aegilops tauschii subsp. strangulata TaxID=200361 RepID=A0A452ZRT0_AEGTS
TEISRGQDLNPVYPWMAWGCKSDGHPLLILPL